MMCEAIGAEIVCWSVTLVALNENKGFFFLMCLLFFFFKWFSYAAYFIWEDYNSGTSISGNQRSADGDDTALRYPIGWIGDKTNRPWTDMMAI